MVNYVAEILITPNQLETFEVREEDMEASGYELSDLEYIEFFGESPQVVLDAAFGKEIGTLFSSTVFNNTEMGGGGSSETPNVLDEEEDKENSPSTTPESERPTGTPSLLRSRRVG